MKDRVFWTLTEIAEEAWLKNARKQKQIPRIANAVALRLADQIKSMVETNKSRGGTTMVLPGLELAEAVIRNQIDEQAA